MTLEQRAQKVRKELFSRYDRLNALWLKAEEQITKYHIPHDIVYVYDEEEDDPHNPTGWCLGVVKIKGHWRICHGSRSFMSSFGEFGYDWTPITECAVITRMNAVHHIPKLKVAVVEESENFIPRVDAAIQSLEKFLGEGENLAELLAERAKLNGQAK